MNYFIHLLIYFDVYVIVALSLNLVVGYTGMLTLAHAAYYGLGGYTYAILSLNLGLGILPALTIVATLAVLLSLIVSLPAWRLKGEFFVLASLAGLSLFHSVFYNWSSVNDPLGSFENMTNGPFGIVGIPAPNVLGLPLGDSASFVLFATSLATICATIIWQLKKSPWGRLLVSMRNDELAARGLGKNTRLVKVQVFGISCAMAAIGGALYVSYIRYIDPSLVSIDESIVMLSMVIVGGSGNFRGPIVGALLLIAIPEALRFLELPDALAANLRVCIYGLLMIALMHFRPQGIAGDYRIG